MGAVSSEKCIGLITDTSKYSANICAWNGGTSDGWKGNVFSGASVLLSAQRQQRNSSCCGFSCGNGPGYGDTWHCPSLSLRDAESLFRTL